MSMFLRRYYYISRRELKIRSFRFPPIRSFYPVFFSFIILFLFILFTSGFFSDTSLASSKNITLSEENTELKNQIVGLKKEILRVNGRLSTVISLNNEIRKLTDLPKIDSQYFCIEEGLPLTPEMVFNSPTILAGDISDTYNLLNLLEKSIVIQSNLNKELSNTLIDKANYVRGIPSIKPIDAPFNRTSFGPRKNPITGKPQFHTGLDMGSIMGQEIHATADGVVERAEFYNGYGLCVIVAHQTGYKTLYAHCSKLIVKKGDVVHRGTILALLGSTGLSTGPHIHYEVLYNDEHLNPADFFFDEEKTFSEKKTKK